MTRELSGLAVPVERWMHRDPVTIAMDADLRQAAQRMRAQRISCLPVVAGEAVVGILTLRDLRNWLADAQHCEPPPVASRMSAPVIALGPHDSGVDALLAMVRHGISHLPIVDGGKLVGILTHSDFVRRQTASSLFMVADIAHCDDLQALQNAVAALPQLLVQLVEGGVDPAAIGRLITSVVDAITRRLLFMAQRDLGPAPVPWAWVACGSQGRQEQTGVSDQDNSLILDDSYDAQAHGAYFAAFAQQVCDGLNACGYVYCPGDMMATNPRWRQPLGVWRGYFRHWIAQPDPKAQMLASVMFDLRVIDGHAALHADLQKETLVLARASTIFQAHLASNALSHRPPLNWFGGLHPDWRGAHAGKVDLKHAGVAPIVDLARLYALQVGSVAVNTVERLAAATHGSSVSQEGLRDLTEALDVMSRVRLRHQAQQVRAGDKPDNWLTPRELAALERAHLRDALRVVKTQQAALSNHYGIGARA
jgi:CBS domain-containing protein